MRETHYFHFATCMSELDSQYTALIFW